MEHLVGAHMAAQDEDELLHLVRHSMDEVLEAPLEQGVRLMTHAAYRGQALILRLLNLAAGQRLALLDHGVDPDPVSQQSDATRFQDERLSVWIQIREEVYPYE